jgi:hypothetical protein
MLFSEKKLNYIRIDMIWSSWFDKFKDNLNDW